MCSNLIFFVIIREICGFSHISPRILGGFSINGQILQVFNNLFHRSRAKIVLPRLSQRDQLRFIVFLHAAPKILVQCIGIRIRVCINNNPDYRLCAGSADESPRVPPEDLETICLIGLFL